MLEINKVYQGDCLEVMKDIDDKSIDLTVTSPPYDNLRKNGQYKPLPFEKFKIIAKELYRVTKEGGVVVWVVGDETKNFCESLSSFKQAIYFVEEARFNLLDTMIYHKTNYAPAYPNMKRYAQVFEYMFVFSKGKPKTFVPIQKDKARNRQEKTAFRQKDGSLKRKIKSKGRDTKDANNIWQYSTGGNCTADKIAFKHPAIFPEQLAKDHIHTWSDEGDVILDPMAGSGTTGKMARELGRNFILIEKEPEYVEICEKRLAENSCTQEQRLETVAY